MAKGQSLRLLTLHNKKAVFMPLEANPCVVPHLKALISGQKL